LQSDVCAAHSHHLRAARECSSSTDRICDTLAEMERMAWAPARRGPKRQAGLVSAGDAQERYREIELVLDDEA
jgi:hypothetical protein